MSDQKYIDEIRQIWNLVKESFRDQLTETTIDLWFGEIDVMAYNGEVVMLGIGSEFKYGIVQDRYMKSIQDKFCELLGFPIHVILKFNGKPRSAGEGVQNVLDLREKAEEQARDARFATSMPSSRFDYTFENFIVGNTNKFAHAASWAVANFMESRYNPLFIWGNSGLGKTHLMCAIIDQMKKKKPDVKIIYTNGEDFTNHMISCLASKTMEDFRNKYRKCDVLLIDDIQFIAGKIAIQEEFFHTFNALHHLDKQIVLTSDRPPRDINPLQDRLMTRFESGLLADIEPPDLELRIAIIKKKAEQVNVVIPDEVLTFLGENLRSNIRQIEGAVKKLGALSFLSGAEITMNVAKSCIGELLDGAEPVNVTVDKIFTAVFRHFGVPREDIVGPKRNKEIAAARHVSVYLIRQITDMSLPNIAKIYSRDHSTIMSSIQAVERRLNTEPAFADELSEIKKEVSS